MKLKLVGEIKYGARRLHMRTKLYPQTLHTSRCDPHSMGCDIQAAKLVGNPKHPLMLQSRIRSTPNAYNTRHPIRVYGLESKTGNLEYRNEPGNPNPQKEHVSAELPSPCWLGGSAVASTSWRAPCRTWEYRGLNN